GKSRWRQSSGLGARGLPGSLRPAGAVRRDPLLYLVRKPRNGTGEAPRVDLEHDFSEDGERRPGASLLVAERAVVIVADPDGDGDAVRAVRRSDEECIAEPACRPGLAHDGDGGLSRVQGVGGAAVCV